MFDKNKLSNLDVGFVDDAISLIQNMTAAEHHLASTYAETKDKDYLEILTRIRRDRSKVLSMIAPKSKGQLYCMFKHLCNAIQNYKELANRMLEDKDEETAKEFLETADSYEKLIKILREEKAEKGVKIPFIKKK